MDWKLDFRWLKRLDPAKPPSLQVRTVVVNHGFTVIQYGDWQDIPTYIEMLVNGELKVCREVTDGPVTRMVPVEN